MIGSETGSNSQRSFWNKTVCIVTNTVWKDTILRIQSKTGRMRTRIPEILVFLFPVHNRDQRENGSKGDTIDYIKNAPHFIEMLNT